MRLRDEFRHLRSTLPRLRRSMGFGVHSPFAYTFITDVLRPRHYRYYDDRYSTIYDTVLSQTAHRGSVMPLPRFRRLLRVAISRRPDTYAVLGDDPGGLCRDALRAALPSATAATDPSRAGILVILPHGATEARIDTETPPATIYLTDLRDEASAALCARLAGTLRHTQTYTNDREAILITRPDFTAQTFRLWF